eukprot:maker-scaffold12_size759060-snap-gene-6.22 protein:Tk05593 transcript:maker-scaffold12_size759060-snap-gene-6.22-mRNA-1 annotation:"sideroflexin 12"
MSEAALAEAEITVLEITAKNDPIQAFRPVYALYFLVEAGVLATLISISGASLFKCPAEPKLPQSVLALSVASLVLLTLTYIKRYLLQRYDNCFTSLVSQVQCACGSVIFASAVAQTFFVLNNLKAETDPIESLSGFYCIPCQTADGDKIGSSKVAAKEGIGKVTLSRVAMAAPGMVAIPLIMNSLEKRGVLAKYPRINAPLQIGLCGLILTFATPLCCAIFEQRASIHVDKLEPELRQKIAELKKPVEYVYYNKGLRLWSDFKAFSEAFFLSASSCCLRFSSTRLIFSSRSARFSSICRFFTSSFSLICSSLASSFSFMRSSLCF